MEASRYLSTLESDYARLAEVAASGLDAPVPSCKGWTVRDVIEHVAIVYLHKIECIRELKNPSPWPPDLSGREPLELLRDSYESLRDLLVSAGPSAPSYTWYEPDQTVGFWYRRMAQETAVHRVDVEEAHAVVTPIDAELATDGIDELFVVMVAGDWSDYPVDEGDRQTIDVVAGGRRWRVGLNRVVVTVTEEPATVSEGSDAAVSGEPNDVLLWLWGRSPLEKLQVTGDEKAVEALRNRCALATQ